MVKLGKFGFAGKGQWINKESLRKKSIQLIWVDPKFVFIFFIRNKVAYQNPAS